MPHIFPSFITCLSLILYAFLCVNVIRARKRYQIAAPNTAGNPTFERISRIQQNMVEQMLLFIPSLWLAALFTWENVSGFIGLIWLAGRILYAYDYYLHASRRFYGFAIAFGASLLLLAMGLLGILLRIIS